MSDSLVLKGVKAVTKHTGSEMLLRNPKRSAEGVWNLKRWWINGGKSTLYTKSAVFDVTTSAGTCKLAVEVGPTSIIRIDHDGSFNFAFYGAKGIDHVALFTENFELIEHYVFPRQSGGQIMTVTPAGAPVRPATPTPPAPDPGTRATPTRSTKKKSKIVT
jgi:hypothetical protein